MRNPTPIVVPPTYASSVEDDALYLLPPKFRDRASLMVVDICELISIGEAGLYKQICEGRWPPPLKSGKRSFWPTPLVAAELKRRLDEAVENQRKRAVQRSASAS